MSTLSWNRLTAPELFYLFIILNIKILNTNYVPLISLTHDTKLSQIRQKLFYSDLLMFSLLKRFNLKFSSMKQNLFSIALLISKNFNVSSQNDVIFLFSYFFSIVLSRPSYVIIRF